MAFWRRHLKRPKSTFWAVLLRENGTLEVLSLPDFALKFAVQNFDHGKKSERSFMNSGC